MEKRQKILLGVALVLGLVVMTDYATQDPDQPQPVNSENSQTATSSNKPKPTPEPASLKEFIDATNEAGEVISQRDAKLKKLSFDLQESELEAKIAQNQLTKEKARLDLEMQEAEISRTKAEADRLRQLDRMSEEVRSDGNPSGVNTSPAQPRFDPLASMLAMPAPELSNSQSSLSDVTVNLVESGTAVVTVNGQMQRVSTGDVVAGHVVAAVSQAEGSITLKAPSGKTHKRHLDLLASRRLPTIKPLTSKDSTSNTGVPPEPVAPDGFSDFVGGE